MKRLTIRNGDGTVSQPTGTRVEDVFYRLAEYEDTGMTPEEVRKMQTLFLGMKGNKYIRLDDELNAMLKAKREGRLTVLPCRIGDDVYGIRMYNHDGARVKEGTVHNMHFGDDMRLCIAVKNVCTGEWGRNIFGSREEAEKAMEMGDY